MRVRFWGVRGSIAVTSDRMNRYGGNTACVEVTLSDGTELILDAGTGIRELGSARNPDAKRLQILLTHLHLDHIQGLMFFSPLFAAQCEIVIWGPASPESSLRDRIARYISAPLAPVEIRELPSLVSFREAEPLEWQLGVANVRAQAVNHRGPTLGYRIEDSGQALCYIPDHEPGLGSPLSQLDDDWISGFDLARGASLLIHDCQYTDTEYPQHLGWGHSPLADALAFGHRVGAQKLLLFHHDPLHTDEFLDAFAGQVSSRWEELGGSPAQVELATERRELVVEGTAPKLTQVG
jgi:phosphoribosyl 1,2-cyclic phosphodiesterase